MKKRLFVVSNRLPLTIEQTESGFSSRPSSGGLVSSINDYLNQRGRSNFSDTYWAGVPGCSEEAWNEVSDTSGDYNYLPVFVPDESYEEYYAGFSNSLLWPLFHYFPSFADYTPSHFEAYMQVNQIFAESLLQQLRSNDVVWIHDYHLLPLAAILREALPKLSIGFFLHIPFPSHELFRVIPKDWQHALLEGMLGADLIGFHTSEYSDHFISSLKMALGLESEGQSLTWNGRQVLVKSFPISIDFDRFHNAGDIPEVEQLREYYSELKAGRKMIFSVDRLDYTKGISHRLKGFEQFLEDNTDYHGKVVFVLSLVPSRDGISKYAERKRLIDEYIGNLNSRLGNISWQPVIYQYTHLSFAELAALYLSCDLALITPLRDGMNLVAKEFVASRRDKTGVLVLSEMAGSANELTEALLINPNDTAEISRSIFQGLEMSDSEQYSRMECMQTTIRQYDVVEWAADFFRQLEQAREYKRTETDKEPESNFKEELQNKFAAASRRLVLLDYDGSLVDFTDRPQKAKPDRELIQLLAQLSEQDSTDVYIVSGRDESTLENWLGELPVGLVAEHGAKIRDAGGHWLLSRALISDWKHLVERRMRNFTELNQKSFLEVKEYSLAWHYRSIEGNEGAQMAADVYKDLLLHTEHLPVEVMHGNKVIEVRNQNVNKGTAVTQLLSKRLYDFVLCIGDDKTDEDMFQALALTPEAFTIKAGGGPSLAKFRLRDPQAVRSLLKCISVSEIVEE